MENYYWGLVAYILGVLMVTPLLWWATKKIPWHPVQAFFRVFVLVFLLTPVYAYNDMSYLAPAWVVGVFEIIRPQSEEGILRGLIPIGLSFIVIYAVETAAWLFLRNRGATPMASTTRADS